MGTMGKRLAGAVALLTLAGSTAAAREFPPGFVDPAPLLATGAEEIGEADLRCIAFSGRGYAGAVGQTFDNAVNVDWPRITKLAPDKPIRWVIVSHPHFDHVGGLRTYLHVGSTIVTHMLNLEFLNHDVLSYEPRTIAPDIVSRWPPTELAEGYNYEAVQESYVITDNSRILRVYYVQPLGHVAGMLMAYLPAERIAFQADLFDTHEPPRAAQLLAMRSLRTQVERMGLEVESWPRCTGNRCPGASSWRPSSSSGSSAGARGWPAVRPRAGGSRPT